MRQNGTITDVPGVKVGTFTDSKAVTGCTVILPEQGAKGGVSVKGGAPGTRETALLHPYCSVEEVHGLVLSGGSAFGLDAACGVMQYLEEAGFGLEASSYKIPIVPAAVIFDLFIGSGSVRPSANWGYEAARTASSEAVEEGSRGAGTGCTVGKINGMSNAFKCGQGSASAFLSSGVVIGVLAVVNALGDIIGENGTLMAGPRNPESGKRCSTLDILKKEGMGLEEKLFSSQGKGEVQDFNTTLIAVATNTNLSKVGVNRMAEIANYGLGRCISPVHTSWDGDTVFVLSTGEVNYDVDHVSAAAAEIIPEAVRRALITADSLGGIPAWKDCNDQ